LQIVSVSYDTDITAFKNIVRKYDMNWINIFNDENLIDKYGGRMPIPAIYLLSKQGKVIYNSFQNGQDSLLSTIQAFVK
jgi:hypothetical protein